MKHTILSAAALIAVASCAGNVSMTMTKEEASLINDSPEVMRILTIEDEADLAVLRSTSTNFNIADLSSPEYTLLA